MYNYKKQLKPRKCGANVLNKPEKIKESKLSKELNKDVEQIKKDKIKKPKNIFEGFESNQNK
tara:strand:+ start:1319 stop:1504 length:186 start_codon:yes stop_codon:yes gene_type:complete